LKSKHFDCPSCGTQGGTIPKPFKGVGYYAGVRIGFLTCPACGGYWHRNRFELGEEIPTNLDGYTDWDAAVAAIKTRRALP
jgi:transcription elongation factor Elf1